MLRRALQALWSFVRGPARLVGPTALGMLGIAMVATGGANAIAGTILTLILAFAHFALMRAYGKPLPPDKAWTRWLTLAGIAITGLVGLWGLFSLWGLPALVAGLLHKVLGTLGIPLMAAGTSWIAWRQLQLLKGGPNRAAHREQEIGETELSRARQLIKGAQGWVSSAILAQAMRIGEQHADQILDDLYVRGELDMEVPEQGGVLFRWSSTPRMTSEEFADEELERLLREQ